MSEIRPRRLSEIGPCRLSEIGPRRLADKLGHYATIKDLKEGPKLCAVDSQQKNAPLTYIWTCVDENNKKNQMAFVFKHRNIDYTLANKIGSLQLERKDRPSSPCHWFEKTDPKGGRHYTLQSVVDQRYLATEWCNEKKIFCLRDTCPVQVTDE